MNGKLRQGSWDTKFKYTFCQLDAYNNISHVVNDKS
jgi:hypothetical protein